MVGNNILHLNQATMVAALQCYFETLYKRAPKVNSVAQPGNGDFVVSTSTPPQETPK